MRISELKEKINFYSDAIFQVGFDMGWNSILEELEQMADREWNLGNRVTAEMIRSIIKEMRAGE